MRMQLTFEDGPESLAVIARPVRGNWLKRSQILAQRRLHRGIGCAYIDV